MGKQTPIDGKGTDWEGLWWHPEKSVFTSAAIDLSDLKKFKGKVRLYVKENKFYNDGENGLPRYNFRLVQEGDEPQEDPGYFSDEEFEELELYGGGRLLRFTSPTGVKYSSIYVGREEVWWHYRSEEKRMVKDWNKKFIRQAMEIASRHGGWEEGRYGLSITCPKCGERIR